ncbi:flagellar biosynthesis protein FlhF [Alkaliphilus transvaalensis]|uniref:flagellar biosynthesis protein FlhF n=1 Tax=Alkaliphilus transvaalensis TaxID=114628 RepID=UPI000479A0FB|nr:flagellar biosynthesis protein FlhF [Alkaliphilus transvaalensis]
MKVKKINAANNHEAMTKVRSELGPDAVILHQRKVKPKGLFGMFKKPYIEIVAAVEDTAVRPQQPVMRPPVQTINRHNHLASNNSPKPSLAHEEALKAIIEKNTNQITQEKRGAKTTEEGLTKEISEIKNMLSTVVKKVNVKDLPNSIRDFQNKDIEKLYHLLKEQEIDEEIITNIINDLMKNDQEEIDDQVILDKMRTMIDQLVISKEKGLKSKIIFFVGPTGVGKTTTIAKLAAHYSLNEGKKIGFISADTYRIAAVEQLKIYSEILNVPVEVIYEAGDIHQAVSKLSHKDIIMVDTAGRSHKNHEQVKELELLLNQLDEKEIYLVVSCTAKNKDIREILKAYGFIDNFKIILTKIDEATTYGTILNTALQTQKPISYLTTGQSVPDDIEVISADKILSLLLKEE